MSSTRTQNAKRNIYASLVNKVIAMLLPFLTRSAIIYFVGALYLGLNGLFTSILSVLSLAELGIGSAMVFSMYEPIAKGDTETVCALLKLYEKIYRIIGTVILVFGLALTPFITKIIHGDIPTDTNIYILYLVSLSNTVVS
ncbi:MAG: polysaccharide biosynthesis protein, partial [Clostridia bacterium]|nr:polysaccharide biosynthesis protein [Clostridia bacterium]